MATSKTRKDRQREQRRKRSQTADRLFRRALDGLAGDTPPSPETPAPASPSTPPPTPSAEETEETEVGVSAFYSLEERAIEPDAERESLSEGSEGSEASIEYEPLISGSEEEVQAPAEPEVSEEPDASLTTASAITEDISVAVDGEDDTVRSGLNALDDFGIDAALVSEVTPPPRDAILDGLDSPDRERVADAPLDLPDGWGPIEGDSPGDAEVAVGGPPVDPFVPATGEVEVSLPAEEDSAEASIGEEPSITEDSADMMYIVLEDTRDFPDLDPAYMPTPPDEPLETPPPEEPSEVSGELSAVKEGMKELREGNRGEAIALFERALRIDPDDAMAQAYLNLAQELMIRDTLPDASLSSVPRLRVGREILLTLDVSADLGAVLSLVDGISDLEALETLLPQMDRATLYQLLADALEQGLIEL